MEGGSTSGACDGGARPLRDVPVEDMINEMNQRYQDLAEKERSLADLEGRVLGLTKDPGEVLDINAGGKVFSVRRDTLCLAKGSVLAALFSGNWEEGQSRDSQGRPFLDIDPYIFGKLVNYLRQRRIEAPESPAPLPVIDADKQAEFRAMAKYYGLAECVPDVKMQRLSPSVPLQTTTGSTPRGYKLTFDTPVVLQAVGVGISGPTAGAMVWVGDGQGSTLREIPISANQTLPPKWASTDPEVTCVAEGFALTLQPPDVFIMVKGLLGGMIFKYGHGSNMPRQAGPFAVTSYAWVPPTAAPCADMFMSMEFVSVAA